MNKMTSNGQAEAVRSIEETVRAYVPGTDGAATRRVVERLLDYIRTVASAARPADLDDRLAELRGWAIILLSPRKWGRFGGLERVRLQVLQECEALRRLLDGRRSY